MGEEPFVVLEDEDVDDVNGFAEKYAASRS